MENLCSYCGSANIDSDGYCDDCGMKVKIIPKKREIVIEIPKEPLHTEPHIVCPKCARRNIPLSDVCVKCNYKFKENEKEVFQAYKYKCPRCNSEKYHAFTQEKTLIEGKTKKTVSLNLNPLKPFTVFNEKEKVVRKPLVITESKFICDNCGCIFK